MSAPQTILDDLFSDIEAAYPHFDRKKYIAGSIHPNGKLAKSAKSSITHWILSAYEFLTFAVTSEVGVGWQGNTSQDLPIIQSKGFLRFLSERILSTQLYQSMLRPCQIIMNDISNASDFSMLRAPPGDLFRDALKNFENLSRRMRVMDYARILDRHLEIRQLTGDPEQSVLANPIDIAENILANKTMRLTTREKRELERLLYNAARNHGVLPSSYYVRDVKRLMEHPFGGGSYGDVYKGAMEKKFVAVKVSRFLWDPETKEKRYRELCKEALIWRPLDHPNVLPFLGICTEGFPSVGLVSPFMDNGDLLSFLRRSPTVDKLRIIEQICLGLDHLHSNKPEVIHGDLKCGNILVDSIGRPRIADFGLSRVVDVASLTASTGIKGTLRWQAPELVHPSQYGGDGRVNVKTDIYAYGMTCLEIFLERTPFNDLNDWEVISMARNGSAMDRVIEITKGCRWIQPIMECCISAEAEHRFRADEISLNVFLAPLYLGLRAGSE